MATQEGKSARTVLVTGASSGIGEELARCFAKDGYKLVLVARSADKLRALAQQLQSAYGQPVIVQPADLTQPGAAQALAAALKRKRVTVDVLVNNAGVLEQGAFCDIAPARHQELIDLNVSGLTAMLSQFVPGMRERGWGRVLNVASIAAFQPVPLLATYAATKAYVLSLDRSPVGGTQGQRCHGHRAVPGHHRHADDQPRCRGQRQVVEAAELHGR